jgi:hypothetical protein
MKFLHQNQDVYQLVDFDPAKAIRIPKNTGTFKLAISQDVSDGKKGAFVVTFFCFDDASHLSEIN